VLRRAVILAGLLAVVAGLYKLFDTHCGENCRPTFAAERLGQAQLERWLADRWTQAKPVKFLSNDGVFRCCDMANTTLDLRADRTIKISVDGFVGTSISVPYEIRADGQIAIGAATGQPSPLLLEHGIHDLYAFRKGPNTYLLAASTVRHDLEDRAAWPTPWPFKFIAQ
jgi:hypothetical protein